MGVVPCRRRRWGETAAYPCLPYDAIAEKVEEEDGLARLLATHESLCNTAAMRAFLYLLSSGVAAAASGDSYRSCAY